MAGEALSKLPSPKKPTPASVLAHFDNVIRPPESARCRGIQASIIYHSPTPSLNRVQTPQREIPFPSTITAATMDYVQQRVAQAASKADTSTK